VVLEVKPVSHWSNSIASSLSGKPGIIVIDINLNPIASSDSFQWSSILQVSVICAVSCKVSWDDKSR